MGEVVLHSYGGWLPKGCRLPCEKAQLVACLSARCREVVHLCVYSVDKQATREGERQRLLKAGRCELVSLDYGSHRPTSSLHLDSPGSIVVEARLYAVPNDVAIACGLTSQAVESVVAAQIDRLAPGGLPSQPWSVHLTLLVRERQLECLRHTGRPAVSARPERIALG